MTVRFKGDVLETVEQQLSKALGKSFPAAVIRVLARTKQFIVQQSNDMLPCLSQFFVQYQFT